LQEIRFENRKFLMHMISALGAVARSALAFGVAISWFAPLWLARRHWPTVDAGTDRRPAY
jgi:hypothetical protein